MAVAARESKTRGCCQCLEGARDLALAAVYDNVVPGLETRRAVACSLIWQL